MVHYMLKLDLKNVTSQLDKKPSQCNKANSLFDKQILIIHKIECFISNV